MYPKVSVVIPVYNVKKEYLDICIGSVVNQTYENLEIILIDDGSTDECRKNCDILATTDIRIKVIHKKNQGVSEARNTGTTEATGDYIMYVDADDIIAQYAIEHGVNEIQKSNADMAIGAVQKIYAVNQFQEKVVEKSYSVDVLQIDRFDELRYVYLNDATKEYVKIEECGYINRGPISRIIKQDLAKRILFPVGILLGEDVIWNMRLLQECKTICVIKEIWYGYMIYGTSAVRKYYGNREQEVARYLNLLIDENQDFCNKNVKALAKNIVIEFYCLLRYEYLPRKSGLSLLQKIKKAKETILKRPWCILKNKDVISELPRNHRLIIKTIGFGGWIFIIGAWEIVNKQRGIGYEI